ncbi:hypothetical protein PghCCS26_60070 [Paenibacillus glycanilyticus]|uniref:Uncharacterized protein n=1 Tax=Paenibacillus glycanilyticus TaxID=126569 RepID=A0ABQ6NXA4_9BACL|nr:hypothetical protein PghCCS26_60070 [Paenibacillus glycanilyticus]
MYHLSTNIASLSICRTMTTSKQWKSHKLRLFIYCIEVLVLSTRQELLYKAVLGQELLYSPEIPKNARFIKRTEVSVMSVTPKLRDNINTYK